MSIYDVVSDIRVLYLTEEINSLKRMIKNLNEKVETLEHKLIQTNEKTNQTTQTNETNPIQTNEKTKPKKMWPIVATISLVTGYVGLCFYKKS